jgi:DNA-binding Xre family transcriptional regulator
MGIVEGKTERRGGEHMPRRGTKLRDSYMGKKYYAKPGVVVPGLTVCRLAAALSERDLAELVDSNQPTINNMEAQTWVKADYRLLRRLCRVLKVQPADLIGWDPVE